MGTRNVTMITLGTKKKLAKYCQWDGCPSGQGQKIVEFIANEMDLEKFKTEVSKLKFISAKALDKLWKEEVQAEGDFVTMEQAKVFSDKYPHLHRDLGGDILPLIQNGEVDRTFNEIKFLEDGLFCEWAYDVDLDTETLYIYQHGTELYGKLPFKNIEHKFGLLLNKYAKECEA